MNVSYKEIIKVNEYVINHKNELNKEVAKVLQKIREEKNLSKTEVAERACMSLTYLGQLESGEYGLTFTKLINICNALEISPNELLEDFIIGDKVNDDLIYNELQGDKNISRNIINYLKNKK